jgi:hypothetical protein
MNTITRGFPRNWSRPTVLPSSVAPENGGAIVRVEFGFVLGKTPAGCPQADTSTETDRRKNASNRAPINALLVRL